MATDHYKLAEQLLDSGVPDDKLAGVGHAILALVDELAADPSEHPVHARPDETGEIRSWQS